MRTAVLILPVLLCACTMCDSLDVVADNEDREAAIWRALDSFAGWTDDAVCISRVEVVPHGTYRGKQSGMYLHARRRIVVDDELAIDATEALMHHELCHAADDQLGLRRGIRPRWPQVPAYVGLENASPDRLEAEQLATTCALGPTAVAWAEVATRHCDADANSLVSLLLDELYVSASLPVALSVTGHGAMALPDDAQRFHPAIFELDGGKVATTVDGSDGIPRLLELSLPPATDHAVADALAPPAEHPDTWSWLGAEGRGTWANVRAYETELPWGAFAQVTSVWSETGQALVAGPCFDGTPVGAFIGGDPWVFDVRKREIRWWQIVDAP